MHWLFLLNRHHTCFSCIITHYWTCNESISWVSSFFSYKDDNSSSFVASSEQLVPILNFANITPFQQERNVILRISTDIALRWTGCCSEWAFLVADPPVISYIAFQVTLISFFVLFTKLSRYIPVINHKDNSARPTDFWSIDKARNQVTFSLEKQ